MKQLICKQCGQKFNAAVKVCSRCGSNFSQQEIEETIRVNNNQVTLGCIGLILVIVFFATISNKRDFDRELIGEWRGYFEGDLLGEYNTGKSELSIDKKGKAFLTLSSARYGVTNYKGYLTMDSFIINSGNNGNYYCSIVKYKNGNRFKLSFIGTGINFDICFNQKISQ